MGPSDPSAPTPLSSIKLLITNTWPVFCSYSFSPMGLLNQ
jgi:hypothetical protein